MGVFFSASSPFRSTSSVTWCDSSAGATVRVVKQVSEVEPGSYWVVAYASRCRSRDLTRKMDVSRNRSTQFARQASSLREKRVEGVPVMHLERVGGRTMQR